MFTIFNMHYVFANLAPVPKAYSVTLFATHFATH